MAEISTDLYPKQNPNNQMSIGDILNLSRNYQTLQGEQAVGEIARGAVDPGTGLLDINKMRTGIAGNPATNLVATRALAETQQLQQRQMDMTKSRYETAASYMVGNADNPTDLAMRQAKIGGMQATGLSSEEFDRQFGPIPNDMNARKKWLFNIAGQLGGAASQIGAGTTGTPTGTGEQTSISPMEAARRRAGATTAPPQQGQRAAPGGGLVVSTPSGFNKAAEANVGAAQSLHDAADASVQMNSSLSTLDNLSDDVLSGPTADVEKTLNQAYQRFFPGKTLTTSPEGLAKTEEWVKIASQIAGAQASALHPTNDFLQNATAANPNIHMSKLGKHGVIHWLQGNNDIPQVMRDEWMAYKNGDVDGVQHADNEHRKWLTEFYKGGANGRFDPRVLQYARMTPEERRTFRGMLPKSEMSGFAKRINEYQQNGWINLGGEQ